MSAENRKIEAADVLSQTGRRPSEIGIGSGMTADAMMSPQAGLSTPLFLLPCPS